MMRSLVVALLGGVLLLVGCGDIQTRAQGGRTTVTKPSAPAAAPGATQQERSSPSEPVPRAASAPQTRAQEEKAATVDAAAMTPGQAGPEARSEIIGPVPGDAASVRTTPVDGNTLGPGRTQRPGAAVTAEPSQVSAAVEPNAVGPLPAWQKNAGTPAQEDATTTIFKEYGEILKACVHEDGRVDYGTLRRRRLDLKPLLMTLADLDPNVYQRWSRDEKLAFWINAYNAKMLEIIARNYPIQSSWWLRLTWPPDDIRHIRGIWTDFKLLVMDEEFTLGEVERRLFRKTFDDPRVYLALTYASRSSPPLRREPYRGPDLGRQLEEQVKQFLASPQGLQIDRRGLVVRLSALFKPTWRGAEFVNRYGTDKKFKTCDPETRAVLNFLTGYLSREDVYFLEAENYTVEYVNFDWRLNDTSRGY